MTGLQNKGKSVIFETHDQVLHGEHIFPSDVKKFSDGGLIDKGKYFGSHFDRFADKDAPEKLVPTLMQLVSDPHRMQTLGDNIKRFALPNAIDLIYEEIVKLS